MTPRPSIRARTRASLLLLAPVLALGACGVNSPQTTLLRYAPADGVEMDGESLDARDVLVISQGDGAPGVLSGSLVNSGSEPLTVTVTVAGQPAGEVTVDPGTSVRLDGGPEGGEGQRTIVEVVETPAGQGVEVRLQADGETLVGTAPVLLPQGTYEQYADDAGGTVEPLPEDEGSSDH